MSTKAQLEQAIDQAAGDPHSAPTSRSQSGRSWPGRSVRTLRVLKLADQGEYDEREEYYSQ